MPPTMITRFVRFDDRAERKKKRWKFTEILDNC